MVLVCFFVHIGDHSSIQDKIKVILVKKHSRLIHCFKIGSYVYFHATSLNLQAILKIIQALIKFSLRGAHSIIILAWDARELQVCISWNKFGRPNFQVWFTFCPNPITSLIFNQLTSFFEPDVHN